MQSFHKPVHLALGLLVSVQISFEDGHVSQAGSLDMDGHVQAADD